MRMVSWMLNGENGWNFMEGVCWNETAKFMSLCCIPASGFRFREDWESSSSDLVPRLRRARVEQALFMIDRDRDLYDTKTLQLSVTKCHIVPAINDVDNLL